MRHGRQATKRRLLRTSRRRLQRTREVPVRQQTQQEALAALAARKEANKTRQRVDNSALYAGSPMYFDCLTCDGEIVVPEDYVTRPYLCKLCQPMSDKGWITG